jgi:hypothetical protein
MVKFAPHVLTRPRWPASWAKTRRVPELTVPNMGVLGEPARTFFSVYGEWVQTPLPSWDDLRRLREQWEGPPTLRSRASARTRFTNSARRIHWCPRGSSGASGLPMSL